ncbi:MAG: DUF3825 domain-containing protein [Intestinimonas massiliensis]|uniref:DUF3825 domain-containing protein n=1 Tax=Intestinimonas massiliensis (ex Afouda et al. 2020) TaxID=1673721 RepID=UPI00242F526C|nr:DUF3825 domain-containing protein [Intestinimonas massiliensis (ex Afouda et al. 2020)]
MASETCIYIDKSGTALPPGHGRAAKYKIEGMADGSFILLEKNKSRWDMVCSGKLIALEEWIRSKVGTVAKEDASKATGDLRPERVHEITKSVMQRVSYLPGIDYRQLNNYLYVLLSRNRVSERNRVINTRLVDELGQPVYLLYVGDFNKQVDMRQAFLVDSISEAQKIFSGVTQTRLPDPLQWSDDVSDYIWDPTMEILSLSDRVVQHIVSERTGRICGQLATLEPATLLRNIKEALFTGQQRACRDCTYALPAYSRQHNSVGMMLPLHVYTNDTELPEAVLLLSKTVHGYSLVTIVTPKQAYISVRMFRNPEETWLKGALT